MPGSLLVIQDRGDCFGHCWLCYEFMITAGIDVGSLAIKVVILDEGPSVRSRVIVPTGIMSAGVIQASLKAALEAAGIGESDLAYILSTGYGRKKVPLAGKEITEITCHARGVHFQFPQARTIIDIGGQDSKAILLDEKGHVANFAMNDKCAAGTGRFLDVMANSLGVKLDEMGDLSLKATATPQISSVCTVFAESEVVSLLSGDTTKENILAGIHQAIARRVASMTQHIGIREAVVMCGGVARNIGVVKALEQALQTKLLVPTDPQITGALGAALIARDYAARN